jgi:hypothetical protein
VCRCTGVEWAAAKAAKGSDWQFYDILGEGWMVSQYHQAAWLGAAAYNDPRLWLSIPDIEGFDAEYFKQDGFHLYMQRPDGVRGVDEA